MTEPSLNGPSKAHLSTENQVINYTLAGDTDIIKDDELPVTPILEEEEDEDVDEEEDYEDDDEDEEDEDEDDPDEEL